MNSSEDSYSSSDSELERIVSKAYENVKKSSFKSKKQRVWPENESSDSDSENETKKSDTNVENSFVIDNTPREKHAQLSFDSNVKYNVVGSDSHPDKEDEKEKTARRKLNEKSKSLSSRLQSGIDTSNLYINVDAYKNPQDLRPQLSKLLARSNMDTELMKKSVVPADIEKKDALPPYQENLRRLKKERKKARDMTKGKNWFDMPAPELTEERKNDLQVLQMRKALDPKRFYKNNDIKGLPKYYQFGKVVETSADFYHARIPKKQRKSTLVNELLADVEFRRYNKRKYAEIQEAKRLGKGPYKHMKRLKKRKK